MNRKTKMAMLFLIASLAVTGCGSKTVENEYVKLGKYKGIEVEMEKADVSDQELEDEIAFQIELGTNSKEITDRAAKIGDTVEIDFEGTIDGKEFDGGSGYGYSIVLGDGMFFEELENGIVGMKTGEEKDIEVVFPKEYEESLAGKKAVYHITLYSIQEVSVPEYTDEFVKENMGYETREKFEEQLKKEMVEMKENTIKSIAIEEIFQKIISEAEFKEIPEELYESCKAEKERQNAYEEELFGMTQEDMGLTEEEIAADIDYMVRERLVMEAIAEEEKMEVTEEECDAYIAYNMDYYGFSTADEMEEVYGDDGIRAAVLKEKLGDFLLENAEKKEVDQRTEDVDLATAGEI